MGWVLDLVQQRIAEQTQRSASVSLMAEAPSILGEITQEFQSAVAEYNGALGDRFAVSTNGKSLLQVVARPEPISTVVVELDAGVIRLACPPPVDTGNARHGTFKEAAGGILSLGNFVGVPQPPERMTPAEFSRFVLEPILFPAKLC